MAQQQHSSEEVDLGYLFNKIKGSYNNCLVFLYRKFTNNRIVLLVIIVMGIIVGLLLNFFKKEVKETSLLVQLNFDSSHYVYNAVDQLNKKIQENDTLFLQKEGLYNEESILISTEIKPIVNILDIVENSQSTNSGYLKTVFDESKFEDDLLTSEMFIPEYKYHRITLFTAQENTDTVVNEFLNYLNNNELLNKIKKVKVENTKLIVDKNKQSISYIDSIVKVYGTLLENPRATGQIYYNSYEVNNGNIHLLFTGKEELLEKNQELEIELQKYNNIVELINKPLFQTKKGFNNIIVIPLVFLLLYFFYAIVMGLYRKAKTLNSSI